MCENYSYSKKFISENVQIQKNNLFKISTKPTAQNNSGENKKKKPEENQEP
jgi:hypothetical protein